MKDKGDSSHPWLQRINQRHTSGLSNRTYIHENRSSAILIDRGLLLLSYTLLPKPFVVTTKLQQTQRQHRQQQIRIVSMQTWQVVLFALLSSALVGGLLWVLWNIVRRDTA